MAQNNIVVVVAAQDDAAGVIRQIEQNLMQLKNTGSDAGNSLGSVMDKVRSTLATVGLAVGLQQAVGALHSVVAGALDVGTQLENMNKKTGVSVSTLSVLRYASALTGNDFETASRGVARMDKAIADAAAGDKEAAGMFRELGLNVKDLVNAPNGAEIAFMRLGKRLADTSGPERQGVAMHMLGRGGMDLLPVLLQVGANYDYLKQKAMEAGQYFDEKSAAQLAETNRKLADMKLKVEGAGIALTEGLTPGINAVLNIIANGKGTFDAMTTFGHALGRSLAFAEAAAYGLVSGLARVAQVSAVTFGDDASAKSLAAQAEEFNQKSQDAMYFAKTGKGNAADAPDPLSAPASTGGPSVKLPTKPDSSAEKKEDALKQLNAALTRLEEESAQVRYQAVKAESDRRMSALESAHKEELIADADFYAQKLAIQQAELEAEKQAELEKQAAIDRNIALLQANVAKHGGRETVNAAAGTMSVVCFSF